MIPDERLTLREGGVAPLGKWHDNILFSTLDALGKRYDFTLDDPIGTISEEGLNAILYGDDEPMLVEVSEYSSRGRQMRTWEGVAEYINSKTEDENSRKGDKWREQFVAYHKCSLCGGSRLKENAQHFRIAGKNIAELSAMSISRLREWFDGVESQMTDKELTIAREILKEIRERLRFLTDVGLGYLSLGRASRTLSGGESQRIRLATQIG